MYNSKLEIMKKVLLVLAFVAVYGVSMSMSTDNVVTVDDAQVTVVADMDDNNIVTPEKEKEKTKKAKKAKASADAKGEGCGETKAKGEGCDGKSEAKKDCGSACGGKK